MDLLSAIGFVAFGLFVGVYGTLVGAGGGFLIVPMLRLVYGASPQLAVGTSLAVVFLNAMSATVSYAKRRRIDYHSGLRFAIAALPGAVIGAYLSAYLSSALFNFLFGLLLVGVAVFTAIRPEAPPAKARSLAAQDGALPKGLTRRTIVDQHGDVLVYAYNKRAAMGLSFGVGFLSNTFGIGGGIIHVPAMVHIFGFPAHIAVATSHFILGITVGVGTALQLWWGHVMYLPAVWLGVGVIVGAQVGAAISPRIHGRWLIRLLSFALAVVGLRLVLSAQF